MHMTEFLYKGYINYYVDAVLKTHHFEGTSENRLAALEANITRRGCKITGIQKERDPKAEATRGATPTSTTFKR